MVQYTQEKLKIKTNDGVTISGVLLKPENPRAVVQINSATAVPKEFYKHIAQYLAENNYASFYFDYRGIGDSAPSEGLKGCTYEITDWAKEDMNAVLTFLKLEFPLIPLFFLCHSVGGQLVGLVPDINRINGVLAISTSSGYAKNMTLPGRLQSFYFFKIVRPIIHLIYGYSKFKFLGIMEDMPISVTNRWDNWCSKPEYFFDPKNAKNIETLSGFKNLTIPIEVGIAIDDPICPKSNVENLWKHFHSSRSININWLHPNDFNLKSIGHFNFFRKTSKEMLWPWALDKLEELSKT